ncbi:MAG: PEP-CTERM sorting domain-containing protein [Phycisphaerales bacterium]|nr:PEP-CTERM sorting domain-containing protein [Phycisphaerales bacterium]
MKKGMICAIVIGAGAASAMADITKNPDLGNYWNPLSPNGTYVYADSFVADAGGVTNLGMWLDDVGTGGSSVRFEVWGDTGGFGPDAGNVIASTGSLAIGATGGLNYYQANASGSLIPGNTYWFAATCVGESGNGSYQVGGHTQNSEQNDNGTFWYSNDSSGFSFDGQRLTPEMAFHVGTVPAPASLALVGLGGLVATRRRR